MTFKSVLKLVSAFLVLQNLLWSSPVTDAAELDEECKNVLSTIIQRQMVALKDCMNEMKFKDGKEKVSKMMCVMKCSLMKEGFLDKDGHVDLVGSMNFLDRLPGSVKEKALHMFMDCHELISRVDPKEESCKSYEPMLKCSQGVINKLCVLAEESSTVAERRR